MNADFLTGGNDVRSQWNMRRRGSDRPTGLLVFEPDGGTAAAVQAGVVGDGNQRRRAIVPGTGDFEEATEDVRVLRGERGGRIEDQASGLIRALDVVDERAVLQCDQALV